LADLNQQVLLQSDAKGVNKLEEKSFSALYLQCPPTKKPASRFLRKQAIWG
jgi:hypothetical protein